MSDRNSQLAIIPPSSVRSDRGSSLGRRLLKVAIQSAWAARGRTEPLCEEPEFRPPDRVYYRSEDGWEAPLWHYPALPGTAGEPVVLAHGLATGSVGFDYHGDRSLARTLAAAGYAVYVLEHRGDRHAIAPAGSDAFDLDDIVAQDVTAALARIRDHSGHSKALWIGHSLGGQLLVAHLARQGAAEIAAGVLICSPVRFSRPNSTTRLAAMATQLLPKSWNIPTRRIHQAMTPLGWEGPLNRLSMQIEDPIRRGLWIHGTTDLRAGLIAQLATSIRSGALVDRDDRIDYLTAMRHAQVPLMAVAAGGDPICPPEAAREVLDHLPAHARSWIELDASWSHLDPLLSPEAQQVLHPSIVDWLDRWRSTCWSTASHP